MVSALTPETLFGSKRDKPAVRQVYGISGTGKTVFLCESLRMACRPKKFSDKHRFIGLDVKHEGYESLAPPVRSVGAAIQSLNKDKISIIHPSIEDAHEDLDELINYLFDMADDVPDFSATLVLEESSTFIGSSVGQIPASVKRMATQGRSKGLTMLLVNQRALGNRWCDTQSASITCFRLAIPDREMLFKRWGVKHEELEGRLSKQKFSFANYDLETLKLSFYQPIKIPKMRRPIVEQKSRYTSLLKNPFA